MTRKLLTYGTISLLAVTGMAVAETEYGNADASPGCEIINSTQNGMVKLESRYSDGNAGSGDYRFTIRTLSGSNNINSTQSGRFTKNAGETIRLGKANLSANGQTYKVELDVTFNGEKHRCSKKIDPTI